ncbi:MAG: hypothetical protein J5510_03935, partial [Prevotella sp.]|nr:hypothetical protein [Prevotella sp.]
LEIYDFYIGGFRFDSGDFNFQRAGGASYFYYADFQRHFETNNVEGAERSRDYLYSLLKDKYESDGLYEIENDQGFMCYLFGKNPRDASSRLGCIYLSRDKGKDGKTRLYLSLSYGPIYYVDKASDF